MEKTFQIYYTSDTHGHIFPIDYAANCSQNSGLLNMAVQIEKDGTPLCWTAEILCRERL